MTKRKWQCWTETPGRDDTVLFEGTERQAHDYYRKHQPKSDVEIHIGYDLGLLLVNGEWVDTQEVTK